MQSSYLSELKQLIDFDNWKQIRENPGKPEKIRRPDIIRKKYNIITHLMSKVSIMYRTVVQTTEIGRFEKSDKKT